jgi:hypothetical protein
LTPLELIDQSTAAAPCTSAGVATLQHRVTLAGEVLGRARAAVAEAQGDELKLSGKLSRVNDALDALVIQQRLAKAASTRNILSALEVAQ